MTQVGYAEILFIDCGFTPTQKRDFLALRFDGRRYLDELTKHELSGLIDDLKERKCTPISDEPETDRDAELTAKERLKRRQGAA